MGWRVIRLIESEEAPESAAVELPSIRMSDRLWIDSLQEDFRELLDDPGRRHYRIDCQGVRYLASGFLAALMLFARNLAHRGGSLTIDHLAPSLREVFKTSRLDQIVQVDAG